MLSKSIILCELRLVLDHLGCSESINITWLEYQLQEWVSLWVKGLFKSLHKRSLSGCSNLFNMLVIRPISMAGKLTGNSTE